MSNSLHVFVASSSEIDAFAHEIEEIFETEIEPVEAEDCFYGFMKFDGELRCLICGNYDDASQFSGKKYQYDLWVGTGGPKAHDENEEKKHALYVFDKLKATGRYSLLATFNFEEALAKFDLDDDEAASEK